MKLNEKISNCKRIIFLIILFLLFALTLAISYSQAVFNDIHNNIFRLHVIANSDSEEDQNLKYAVRDNIISYLNDISKDSNSKSDVILLANTNLDIIQEIAQGTIYELGYTYPVKVSIGQFDFPTKKYGDISFPSGAYDALKIEIGDSIGQNWWCVMFPPLCFVDVTSGIVPDESKEIMQEQITEEGYALISENDIETQFKFKLVEIFQKLNMKLSKI